MWTPSIYSVQDVDVDVDADVDVDVDVDLDVDGGFVSALR